MTRLRCRRGAREVEDLRTTPPQAVVLVVEDDPIIRMAALDLVEEAGFTAVPAADAAEAVAILERRLDIRVVFTDIDMPGSMCGMKLAMCVRDRWPPIRLVVVSGHRAAEVDDLPEDVLFFTKPYRAVDMKLALKTLVEATAG
jgi:CheY-like chemotaxis protein